MHYTIEKLLIGDSKIVGYFEAAAKKWVEIIESSKGDQEKLAKILTHEQYWFEENCGGLTLGQEIMVIVGIAQYFSTAVGFGDNSKKAILVYNAFQRSYCSMEVKFHAERVFESYDLQEISHE